MVSDRDWLTGSVGNNGGGVNGWLPSTGSTTSGPLDFQSSFDWSTDSNGINNFGFNGGGVGLSNDTGSMWGADGFGMNKGTLGALGGAAEGAAALWGAYNSYQGLKETKKMNAYNMMAGDRSYGASALAYDNKRNAMAQMAGKTVDQSTNISKDYIYKPAQSSVAAS